MKRITIEVESEADNNKIESNLRNWIKFQFQKYDEAKIKIEEIK